MLLMLLKRKEIREELVIKEDPELCEELSGLTSRVIDQEMKALVLHPALRLPQSKVNPKTLEQFDLKIIAEEQQKCAPVLTSMLYICAGLNSQVASENTDIDEAGDLVFERELGDNPSGEEESESRGRNRKQIATVSLCMLCYSRNQQSNVLQMIAGYFAFADNVSKCMVEIFHRMGIMVVYETVRRALQFNAVAVLEELKAKVWEKRFFLSFDNMNFYEQRRDE